MIIKLISIQLYFYLNFLNITLSFKIIKVEAILIICCMPIKEILNMEQEINKNITILASIGCGGH